MPDTDRKWTDDKRKRGSSEVPERILEASRRLLARGGVEALTISAIAAEGDVYSSAISYHFGGKEGLWATLVDRLLREADVSVQADFLAMPMGRSRIARIVETYDMFGGHEVQSAFFETLVPALRSAELRRSLMSLYEDAYDKLGTNLGANEHPGQQETLRLVAQIVLAFTDGVNVQRLIDPDADCRPAIALFERMITNLLQPILGFDDEDATDAAPSEGSA